MLSSQRARAVMKSSFKEFTNPRHVYDGYFETYFIRPFFHHYADFRGKESAKSCGMSLLAWLIVTLGIAGILMGQVGLMGPEAGFGTMLTVGIVWTAASLVPLVALIARTAHGAPDEQKKPRLLGVDTLLAVSCLLFFLLGVLMMITTLNSGSLNPNAGYDPNADTATFELEEVTEEPIFTYQENSVEAPSDVVDTLGDMTDPDAVSPDDSYDPTLDRAEPDDATDEISSDSTVFF